MNGQEIEITSAVWEWIKYGTQILGAIIGGILVYIVWPLKCELAQFKESHKQDMAEATADRKKNYVPMIYCLSREKLTDERHDDIKDTLRLMNGKLDDIIRMNGGRRRGEGNHSDYTGGGS